MLWRQPACRNLLYVAAQRASAGRAAATNTLPRAERGRGAVWEEAEGGSTAAAHRLMFDAAEAAAFNDVSQCWTV